MLKRAASSVECFGVFSPRKADKIARLRSRLGTNISGLMVSNCVLVKISVFHDYGQILRLLEYRDVRERICCHQQKIGQIAFFH